MTQVRKTSPRALSGYTLGRAQFWGHFLLHAVHQSNPLSTVRIQTSHGCFQQSSSPYVATLEVPSSLASKPEIDAVRSDLLVRGIAQGLINALEVSPDNINVGRVNDLVFRQVLRVVKCPTHPDIEHENLYVWLSPYSGRCLARLTPSLPGEHPEEPAFERLLVVKRRLHTMLAIWARPEPTVPWMLLQSV